MILLKSKNKMMRNICGEDQFSNDESAYASTPLKTVSTTDILIDQVHKFQNSYFKEHL